MAVPITAGLVLTLLPCRRGGTYSPGPTGLALMNTFVHGRWCQLPLLTGLVEYLL